MIVVCHGNTYHLKEKKEAAKDWRASAKEGCDGDGVSHRMRSLRPSFSCLGSAQEILQLQKTVYQLQTNQSTHGVLQGFCSRIILLVRKVLVFFLMLYVV